MKLKVRAITAVDTVICFVRKTWRPLMLVGVAVATWVNLVLIPVVTWKLPDLTEAAAWIAACGALQWVRSWEKIRSEGE